jgi:alpha-galactosidase
MIHYNSDTQTFALLGKRSHYTLQIDPNGRPTHLAWGPRPTAAESVLDNGRSSPIPPGHSSFDFQSQRDELPTYGDFSIPEIALKVSFPGEALPIRDVRLRYTGHEIGENGQLPMVNGQWSTAHSEIRNPKSEILKLFLHDPIFPFALTLCYRLWPDYDVIERWWEVANEGATAVIHIEQAYFAALHLPPGTTELTTTHGAWAAEFTPQRHVLPIGRFSIGHRSVQTGHSFNPFFLANRPGAAGEESGVVYFGALAYSGAWQLAFEQQHSGDVRIFGGYNPFDFELILQPGERHVTPAFVCGVSGEGWGGASRRLHAFARDCVLPPSPPRPVLYNSWEATYFALSHEGQAALARKAAAIGVELFVVDDGWFGGRRNDRAGLGDWTVSPDVFPGGLQPLIAEVHALGMQFGLWFEPEMVNPDSDLYRAHPDWVLHFPGRPRTEARNQLILDYGRAEVVAHVFDLLDTLLATHEIDFIKWDMNRSATEPGSVAGKAIWRAHVAGVYKLMDRLRQKYPRLSLQSCSGGGGRVDLGVLARVDQVWTSDNTDALDRLRIQEGYSLAYPARAMEAWVTHEKNHQTGRVLPLSTRFDVAMRGVLGIGSNLNDLSDAELKEYATYIAFYKRIRHVVQGGDLYRLERLEERGASVILYVLGNGREAVYSVAVQNHLLGQRRPSAPLRGLDPAATYTIADYRQREIARLTGYHLMTQGLSGEAHTPAGYSNTLYLTSEAN